MNYMNKTISNNYKMIRNEDILFLDGERTFPFGQDKSRRWMELAIIDGNGASVYHGYFNPGFDVDKRFYKKGLTDDLLMFCPEFDSQWLHIKQLLKDKHVVSWWMENEKKFFPEELSFCKQLHCAQARFSPLVGKYSLQHGDYTSIGMWDAFDILQLEHIPGYRHRASTDVHAMKMIWDWLDKTQLHILGKLNQHNRKELPF